MLKTIKIYSLTCKYLRLPVTFLLLSLSACVSHTSGKQNLNAQYALENTNVLLKSKNYPNCIIILPAKGDILKNHAVIVEDVLERHFQIYFEKIVSARERRSIVKNRAYDLSSSNELKHFSDSVECNFGLLANVKTLSNDYAVTWAYRSIDLTLQLVSIDDNSLIWNGRYYGSRKAGGLPTGPLGIVLYSRAAYRFANDKDGTEAMIEDVIRHASKEFRRK